MSPTRAPRKRKARHDSVAVQYENEDFGRWIKIWCARCGAPREPHDKWLWECGEGFNNFGIEEASKYREVLKRRTPKGRR